MISLGDKIRDAIVEKLGKKNELKAVVMQRAADMLGMSKSSLYAKLNEEPIPVDLLDKIQRIIGINIAELKNNDEPEGVGQELGIGKHKFLTIPIKNHRVVKVYMPEGYDKDDLKTMVQHINLWERNF